MAFNYNLIVSGTDILLTKLNGLITKLNGYLNAIPGSALLSASVPKSALQNKKGLFTIDLEGFVLGAASIQNVDAFTLTNIDGASSSTWRIVGWSFHAGNSATAITKGAGNQLLIKVAGVTQITIDLNSASLAVGTPIYNSGLSVSATSGQTISVDYVYGGVAGSYTFPHLQLFVTHDHVST